MVSDSSIYASCGSRGHHAPHAHCCTACTRTHRLPACHHWCPGALCCSAFCTHTGTLPHLLPCHTTHTYHIQDGRRGTCVVTCNVPAYWMDGLVDRLSVYTCTTPAPHHYHHHTPPHAHLYCSIHYTHPSHTHTLHCRHAAHHTHAYTPHAPHHTHPTPAHAHSPRATARVGIFHTVMDNNALRCCCALAPKMSVTLLNDILREFDRRCSLYHYQANYGGSVLAWLRCTFIHSGRAEGMKLLVLRLR